jgi:hypothetical protein
MVQKFNAKPTKTEPIENELDILLDHDMMVSRS